MRLADSGVAFDPKGVIDVEHTEFLGQGLQIRRETPPTVRVGPVPGRVRRRRVDMKVPLMPLGPVGEGSGRSRRGGC